MTMQRTFAPLVRLAVMVGTALFTAHGAAQVSAWKPDKPIELVVPSGPGGGTDVTARLIQRIWQERRMIEVPVTVTNKPGGSGGIALSYLRGHAADPQFLQVASAVLLTNHIMGRSTLTYTDFTPIALLNSEYIALAVRTGSPIATLADMVARLKQDPGALSIAVGTALGGANHVVAALVARAAGADPRKLRTVVFKSSAESAVAALGGHIDVMATSASLALPHVRAGTLRVISVSAPKRMSGVFAAAPTMKEQGVDTVVDNFRLMIAAQGIAPAQISFWDEIMGRLVQTDEWKKDLEANVWENTYMGSRETRRYLEQQYGELKNVLAEMGFAK